MASSWAKVRVMLGGASSGASRAASPRWNPRGRGSRRIAWDRPLSAAAALCVHRAPEVPSRIMRWANYLEVPEVINLPSNHAACRRWSTLDMIRGRREPFCTNRRWSGAGGSAIVPKTRWIIVRNVLNRDRCWSNSPAIPPRWSPRGTHQSQWFAFRDQLLLKNDFEAD